jgi:hypothetical protein
LRQTKKARARGANPIDGSASASASATRINNATGLADVHASGKSQASHRHEVVTFDPRPMRACIGVAAIHPSARF